MARLRNNSTSSSKPPPQNSRVQQHKDEFVNIGLWLDQQRRMELERDVIQLKRANEELTLQLEAEKAKVQQMDSDRYNLQCLVEQLEREKRVSFSTDDVIDE